MLRKLLILLWLLLLVPALGQERLNVQVIYSKNEVVHHQDLDEAGTYRVIRHFLATGREGFVRFSLVGQDGFAEISRSGDTVITESGQAVPVEKFLEMLSESESELEDRLPQRDPALK